MLFGNKNKFAVECDVTLTTTRWVYGYFWFYLNGHRIGSEDDSSVDLNGCRNWIRDFVNEPCDRYEEHLYDLPKDVVFELLAGENAEVDGYRKYDNIYARFHISYLGMSSFDEWTILLVKNELGHERCVWRHRENEILEAYLEKDELENVLAGFHL
ncbi:hypothetical protein GTP44_04835 [Duganella sp. FT50W]|uniref:Uncharacterized protein n=1 Tax=Duganella lactea TaxID=2692173 RepID=A0A6L8MFJ7_9BURK|nr:Imm42 family immunity protein [Duganella lactea]MYM81284.1 hypothetical protein [Duganella lactea]